jgi:hypothetical protein
MHPNKPSIAMWINVILGLFLVVSPWIFGYAGEGQAVINSVGIGLVIAVIALLAIFTAPSLPGSWVNFVLLNVMAGVEAIIGPQLLKFSDAASWVSVPVGLAVIFFAMLEMWRITGRSSSALTT